MLIAHLSDLHLGRPSPGDPHGAERLNSLRQAIVTLTQRGPDLLVISGDTFESPHVDHAVIEEAARTMAAAASEKGECIPVVIIPGNHDPADAEKLWSAFRKCLGAANHVHLVLAPRVIELAEGKLLVEAYPCLTRYSAEPPWEQRLATKPVSGAVRVIVAHGTLQGGPVPEDESDAYPFTQADLDSLGADYVALGHFHGIYPAWGNGDECARAFSYAGTHEPTAFSGDAGYALLANLSAGQATRLERIKTGRRQWRLLHLAGPADLAQAEA